LSADLRQAFGTLKGLLQVELSMKKKASMNMHTDRIKQSLGVSDQFF
jgi:hypothetical protein